MISKLFFPLTVLGATPSPVPPPGSAAEIDEAELKRRTDFLKAQRDKLLAMKKEEREKQLAEVEKAQAKTRPKSAKAARSAFGECSYCQRKGSNWSLAIDFIYGEEHCVFRPLSNL